MARQVSFYFFWLMFCDSNGVIRGATVCRNCYELFKAEFPDKWQRILELHEQSAMLLGNPQTVAMRGQEFQKFGTKISGLVSKVLSYLTVMLLKVDRWILQLLVTVLRLLL